MDTGRSIRPSWRRDNDVIPKPKSPRKKLFQLSIGRKRGATGISAGNGLSSGDGLKPGFGSGNDFDSGSGSGFGNGADAGGAADVDDSVDASADNEDEYPSATRRVFVNTGLPPDLLDKNGLPKTVYPRNKIRTARYKPLTFVPKNIWYQFHNIANIYFLLLIVLTVFPVFGAFNPALSAVPLICIIIITGIKDAIEDTRRSLLDSQLNNQKCMYLANWHNPNAVNQRVGIWRRIKKFTSKILRKLYRIMFSKGPDKNALDYPSDDEDIELESDFRFSIDATRTRSRHSLDVAMRQPSNDKKFARPSLEFQRAYKLSRKSVELPPYVRREQRKSMTQVAEEQEWAKNADIVDPRTKQSVINPNRIVNRQAYFERTHWKSLKVGDIVKLRSNEEIPADVAILSTSELDGICFVETKNLDGETNLKVRHALRCTMDIKNEEDCEAAVFEIESEAPHADMFHFAGVARYQAANSDPESHDETSEHEPMDLNSVLLRGCTLRNTKWVIGLVLYTGSETKVMLNAGLTPSKISRMSRELNWTVLTNFLVLFVLCLITGLLAGVYSRSPKDLYFVFADGFLGGSSPIYGIISFFSGLIIYQNLVPISLYITIEIIRTIQAFFIYSDCYMYYDKLDYPCTPKSWNISDDLGQIEYIFSDKTGTLTQNLMEFRKCTINGKAYGEAYTEAQAGADKRKGINIEQESKRWASLIEQDRRVMTQLIKDSPAAKFADLEHCSFVSSKFFRDLEFGDSGSAQKTACFNFIFALSICHTVNAKVNAQNQLTYRAQSPDEAALVETARDMGFALLQRNQEEYTIFFHGKIHKYQLLDTIEFTSDRKRMSVIVRVDDNVMLYCKGADNVIYERLAEDQDEIRKATEDQLAMFSSEGLRTMCICCKEIAPKRYAAWKKKLKAVANELDDRDSKMLEVGAEIETDLVLLGGTAIEDRLQDGVPDSIAMLSEAGIKIWVLTGDKVETAINIGYSCNLLRKNLINILFTERYESFEDAKEALERILFETFGLRGTDEELRAARKDHAPPRSSHALIIDGSNLKMMLDDRLKYKFLLLCKQSASVLCCRVSPSQKAAVTKLVKDGLGVMTLAIGDGANDVFMIQSADVGVGIAGEEGRQAVMSADYAIGQFRFLTRLLLVHGRWDYRRLSVMLGVFFYKNVVWTFTLFWFQIFARFDATMMFQYTYVMLYNLAFTSLSSICLGILDQDVSDHVSLRMPRLYARGILRLEWTRRIFWTFMLEGLYQSALCFFLPYLLIRPEGPIVRNGRDVNAVDDLSIMVAAPAVIAVNIFTLLHQAKWDIASIIIDLISIFLLFFWTGVYGANLSLSDAFGGTEKRTFGALSNWALMLLVVVACLLPRLCFSLIQRLYFPTDVHIVQEMAMKGEIPDIEPTFLDRSTKDATAVDSSPESVEKSPDAPSKDLTGVSRIDLCLTDNDKYAKLDDYELSNIGSEEIPLSPQYEDIPLQGTTKARVAHLDSLLENDTRFGPKLFLNPFKD